MAGFVHTCQTHIPIYVSFILVKIKITHHDNENYTITVTEIVLILVDTSGTMSINDHFLFAIDIPVLIVVTL